MSRDIRAGLSTDPKDLSPWPKYFYDAEGSRIFEEITDLPEYYQTRTESSILKRIAPELFDRTGCRELVELGSGAASDKTRALIEALLETDPPSRYVPFDVSESAVRESGDILLREYPNLRIQGYVGDFDKSLGALLGGSNERGGRLVIFLGGTIGNFTPDKRREFLSNISAGLIPGDHILIGMDLVKDPKVLEAAYDDASGTTARFNKNMLKVLNARLDADFDPDQFAHRATYNAEEQRIEMWLDAIQNKRSAFPPSTKP
jgi:L-histidine N-alpha-methyltransferase